MMMRDGCPDARPRFHQLYWQIWSDAATTLLHCKGTLLVITNTARLFLRYFNVMHSGSMAFCGIAFERHAQRRPPCCY
jgi:hypothetical protein